VIVANVIVILAIAAVVAFGIYMPHVDEQGDLVQRERPVEKRQRQTVGTNDQAIVDAIQGRS
jgi:hypothetical protein